MNVEFVSYTGKYPNLCAGILTLKINEKIVEFPKSCMLSGGCCFIDQHQEEHTATGKWAVNVPEEYKEYKEEIEDQVNKNVTHGCCGGCI